jgi:serine protease Do
MRSVTPAGVVLLGLLLLAGAASGQVGPDDFASLARTALPAVVTITVPDDAGLPDDDSRSTELLHELFGGPLKGRRQAVGTGVILDADGLVITSAHAVAGAADIEATASDRVSHKATLVGVDRKTDVAVLRLRGSGPFPHARLGDSDAARVGDWVLAIASPYGLGTTVTRGIISAVPRARPRAGVDDLLQTDAATFLDSVGGPLVNARGEVIGFTTVLTLHDFGISFALPSNAARTIVSQLVREGAVTRGTLDVRFQELTPGLGKALGVADAGGLLIADIDPQGAAARAGVHRGDVVTKLDGRPVEVAYDVEHVLRASSPAQTIELTYWRRGQILVSRVSLGKEVEPPRARPLSSRPTAMLRFDVRALTPEMGVVVSLVRPDRPSAEPGLRVGDIIREINREPVRTMADFERLVDAVKPRDWLALLVQRGQAAVYVAVEAREATTSALPGTPRR